MASCFARAALVPGQAQGPEQAPERLAQAPVRGREQVPGRGRLARAQAPGLEPRVPGPGRERLVQVLGRVQAQALGLGLGQALVLVLGQGPLVLVQALVPGQGQLARAQAQPGQVRGPRGRGPRARAQLTLARGQASPVRAGP